VKLILKINTAILIILATFFEGFPGIPFYKDIKIGDLFLICSTLILIYIFINGYKIKWSYVSVLPLIASFVFLLIPYIASIFNNVYLIDDTKEMIKVFISLYGLILLYIGSVKDINTLNKLVSVFVLSVAINAFLGVLETRGVNITNIFHSNSIAGGYSLTGRSEGLTMHPNFLGILCAMTIPIIFCLEKYFFKSLVIKLSLITLMIYGVIISGSRSALVAGLIGGGFTWIYGYGINRKSATIFGGLIIVGILIVFLNMNSIGDNTSSLSRLFQTGINDTSAYYSDQERREIMSEALINIENHPIIGDGMRWIQHVHCIYIQFIESVGLFGFLSLVSFILFFLIGGIRSIRNKDIFGISLFASVLTFLVNGVFSNNVYTRPMLVPFFLFSAYLNFEKEKLPRFCNKNYINNNLFKK